MKKMLTIMAVAISMMAQAEGNWQVVTQEADELKGVEAGTVYIYEDSVMGSFVLWNWDTPQFRIVSARQLSIETGWTQYVGNFSGVNMLVGIYTADGKMEEKFTMWLDTEKDRGHRFERTRDAGSLRTPIGQKKHVKKIFEALQTPGKYVRFVCERYNDTDFDLKVMPFIRPTY